MKKVTKVLGVLAFSFMLGITSPVVAQTSDNTTTTTTSGDDEEADDEDDAGKWGLAGLLGLLGLLGLKRRDDDRRQTSTNR